jgi:hypothetical protein
MIMYLARVVVEKMDASLLESLIAFNFQTLIKMSKTK